MADETKETPETSGRRAKDRKGRGAKGKLLLVGVLIVGAAGGYFLKGGGASEPVAGATATSAPPEPGTMIELEPLSLNLADDRYLRVGVAVQLVEGSGGGGHGEDAGAAWLAEHGPVIRDLLIQQLGGAYVADLATAEGREALRATLVAKAGEHLEDDIYALYFTEFVMQ
jgi:flagellar FliL protein